MHHISKSIYLRQIILTYILVFIVPKSIRKTETYQTGVQTRVKIPDFLQKTKALRTKSLINTISFFNEVDLIDLDLDLN